ncbi:MAG: alpha-galactosidase [Victivallaceae bacterium]
MITADNGRFKLESELFSREIVADAGGLRTTSVLNKINGREYVRRPEAAEFQMSLNGEVIYSYNKPEYHVLDGNLVTSEIVFALENHTVSNSARGSEILALCFKSDKHKLRLTVFYEIYPDLPGCNKWLKFDCLGGELHLKNLFFEVLNTCPGEFVEAEFFKKQGTVLSQPMFAACGDEDIIQVHNMELNEGLFIGNGAPGPLRYYMAYPNWSSGISCGYAMGATVFNVYLKAGESFTTDKAYLFIYAGDKDCPAIRNCFREMIRRDLPMCPDNGSVMYCTWLPFLKNISESLLLELVDRAAAMGFKYFVVDDGWFTDNSWTVDPEKFPNGLEVISERVRAAGMKFGLWFNIGNDYGDIGSRPEDNALDYHGKPKPFGFGGKITTRCMASKNRDFIIEKLSSLAKQYNVDYFKLDFSCITSPYGMMPVGCSSTAHEHHRDASDAVFQQYQSMMYFRNAVKVQFPDLIIDFSFETFGTETPSIGALRYSELHHVSNLNTRQLDIVDARKIRNTLYNFCTVLPPERILGSLICLQNENDIEHLLTAFIGTPLVAGDLRKISGDNCQAIAGITATLNSLIQDKPLSELCKLRGDKYIGKKDWDGFVRYSRNGKGIVCLFKNHATDETVTVRIPQLPGAMKFQFHDAESQADLGTWTAKQLNDGIVVDWLKEKACRAVAFRPAK